MGNLSTGRDRIEIFLNDASQLLPPNLGGRGLLQVRSERGIPGVPKFIRNDAEYIRAFGTYSPDGTTDSTYAILMLRAGAQFYVSRVSHYTDPAIPTTVQGTKADATLTVAADVVVWTAKAGGKGYNGVIVTTAAPASKNASVVDVIVSVPDISDGDEQIVRDFPIQPTVQDQADLNAKLRHVDITSFTTNVPIGSVQLGSGVGNTVGDETKSAIVATDYIGDNTAKTGVHAFDSIENVTRFINIRPVPEIDQAIINYVENRKGIKADLGVPLNITPSAYEDYRNGTGVYAAPGFQGNSFRSTMVLGQATVPSPRDPEVQIELPGVVSVAANKLLKDGSDRPWASTAERVYNRITTPNFGVSIDMKNPANSDIYDSISESGATVITNRNNIGAVYYGDQSMLLDKTSVLKSENVADLIVYLERNLPALIEQEQFKPNAPSFWRAVYYKVRPFIERLVEGEAIYGGENTNWFWLGDQDANSIDDIRFNTANDIQSGIYRARFVFQPIPAAAKIGIDIVPTTQNTIINVVNNFELAG